MLITGANGGIGKDVARQLALRDDVRHIHLAGRDDGRLREARASLEATTGRSVFDTVLMDVSDPDSVRVGLKAVDTPLDAVVMTAGGTGGSTPFGRTADGVTEMVAVNVLGHVVLLEELLSASALTGTALYAGSEAARGAPRMRIARPVFATSSADEFGTVIDGSFFRDRKLHYGQVKYLAALWIAALARRHPELRFVTVSPGQTGGTEALRDQPWIVRTLGNHLLFPYVLPAIGLVHPVEAGTGRFVAGLTDSSLLSRGFYASAAQAMIGPLQDQAEIVPDLRDEAVQDSADQAIHRFLA